jgi:hypothetical protein
MGRTLTTMHLKQTLSELLWKYSVLAPIRMPQGRCPASDWE